MFHKEKKNECKVGQIHYFMARSSPFFFDVMRREGFEECLFGVGEDRSVGERERREERRREEEPGRPTLRPGGLSGRSLVWNRAVTGETLCLLTSKAASAASAAFEATQQNTHSGLLNPPLAHFQPLETKMFPSSAWLSLAMR